MSTFPTKEKALGMYKKMYTIRKYEESIYYLFLEGIMPGSIHQSTGEEASAAFKMQKKPNVVVCFLGDGATNEGSYHETMNAVGLWKLPVIYVCENNLFSANTSIKLTCCQENVAAGRAEVYGIPSEVVDGNDVMAVNEAVKMFRARILDEGAATEDELQKMEADIEAEIDEAVEYAKNAPLPENESALHDVFWEG